MTPLLLVVDVTFDTTNGYPKLNNVQNRVDVHVLMCNEATGTVMTDTFV